MRLGKVYQEIWNSHYMPFSPSYREAAEYDKEEQAKQPANKKNNNLVLWQSPCERTPIVGAT